MSEIWMDECYNPPFELGSGALLDLGAHVGLATRWLLSRYAFVESIALEPLEANYRLAVRNIESLSTRTRVLRGAAGPASGKAVMSYGASSNTGSIRTDSVAVSHEVPVYSVDDIIGMLEGQSHVSLLKMDIEGAEAAIFRGSLDWLDRVDAMAIELHPPLVAYGKVESLTAHGQSLVDELARRGWTHHPPRVRGVGVDFFVRN
jgi:FkbM family methyltransferase